MCEQTYEIFDEHGNVHSATVNYIAQGQGPVAINEVAPGGNDPLENELLAKLRELDRRANLPGTDRSQLAWASHHEEYEHLIKQFLFEAGYCRLAGHLGWHGGVDWFYEDEYESYNF